MNGRLIFIVSLFCVGLSFSMNFGAEMPQNQKGYAQRFREWIGKMYESAPAAEKVAIGAAGTGIVFGGMPPQIALNHAAGGYMAFQGVKQAWEAIVNGNISSSLAAGPLLTIGLGMSVLPTANLLNQFSLNRSHSLDAQNAIIALGIGVSAAGLISAVYHNLMASVVSDEIPKTEVVDQALKAVVLSMVKATIDDDVAYPTRSIKINALLKRKEFLSGDDTDSVVLEACNDLIKEMTEDFLKKSEKERAEQDKKEKEIDNRIDHLREVMAEREIKVDDIEKQIEFLNREIGNFPAYERAVVALLIRLRSRLAVDLIRSSRSVGAQK